MTRAHGSRPSTPTLWRSRSDKVIAGVLGGLAEKFNTNATFLRVLFTALTIFSAGFPGVLIYLILWAIARPIDDPELF
ncbi:MAG: PspC domain-containing protein [Gemmatimonadaceae bacterium]